MRTFCRATLNYVREGGPAPVEVEIRDGRSADLPGWEDHVDAMEKAAGSHPRRRKVRDDATLVVVEHDRR